MTRTALPNRPRHQLGSCFHGSQFFQTPKSRPSQEAKALIPAKARISAFVSLRRDRAVVTESQIPPSHNALVNRCPGSRSPQKVPARQPPKAFRAGRAEHRAVHRFGGASSARPKLLRQVREDGASWNSALRQFHDRRARDARAPHFARELEQLHPDNRHVRDKIRQQLQVLPSSPRFDATSRDAGLLLHVQRGVWRLP